MNCVELLKAIGQYMRYRTFDKAFNDALRAFRRLSPSTLLMWNTRLSHQRTRCWSERRSG